MDCPLCDGKIVEKKTRKGKLFYGCNHYPKCKFASWYKPVDEKCPKCDNYLIENIYQYGGAFNSLDIFKRISKDELSAKPIINYYERKYRKQNSSN